MTVLSIVIPAYNEENGIAEIASRVLSVEPALKKVGVPPPKCSSFIFGLSPKIFTYIAHSFSTAFMYGISTAWFLVMRVLQPQ